ncbi:MAG: PSD1 and planctomycete cytochrome C domain-containing protein [Pirellulales bacterium]
MNDSQLGSDAAKAAADTRGCVERFAAGAWLYPGQAVWVHPLALIFISALLAQGGEIATVDFNRDIRPILSNSCLKCHGPDEDARKADLRLDTREGALADRGGYRAINPEEPPASALLLRITAAEVAERMPPAESGLQLSAHQIALISRWIEQGAPFEQHWAFRPILQPPLPMVTPSWPRNEIDSFVLEQLTRQQIEPSPEATPYTLIRRVNLDVRGLPPTPAEVDEYIADQSPDAYERMVERALASPHYGERWGRHWLDQARYADTNGYSVDAERSMWPYRDWVIQALNDDMPFDRFTIEQLAGDLLPNSTREQLIATGFHRNTLINEEGGTDEEQFRVETVVDRVNTTGTVWLGLTIGCAQCHTHKFDPISQHEYYRLFAFFNTCEDANGRPPTLHVTTPEQQTKLDELDARIVAATDAIAEHDRQHNKQSAKGSDEAGGASASTDSQRVELTTKLTGLQEERTQYLAAIPQTMILRERTTTRESNVLIRGDFLRKGDVVLPDTPAALPKLPASDSPRTRLDLARWIVDRQNPLTARVTGNRIWAHYFGRGLVETENDFGRQGTPPTHPKLLDWLAAELMDRGWSQKSVHRLILNSATYLQTSQLRADLAEVDPLNKLLGRQSRLRVDAEIVRDLGLSVSGLLHDKIGGPGAYPPQPDDVFAFTQVRRPWPTSTGPDRYRRGMYTVFMRSAPYPMLTTFDSPVFNVSCTFRQRSNTPLQSLAMSNDETMIEVARTLGQRAFQHAASDCDRIGYAFQICFARPPDPFEVERLGGYVEQQRQIFASNPEGAILLAGDISIKPVEDAAAWTALARVLLNLDEFITRE